MATVVRLLAALWCGALWTIGLLVVPLLFSQLEPMRAAGTAGSLFRLLAYGGLLVALLMLVADRFGRGLALGVRGRRTVLLMAVGVGLGYFGTRPVMDYGRALIAAGQSVPAWADFGTWHGVSSVLYFLVAVLGLRLVAVVR
ncbi:hypothetical protein CDO44_14340 [Pigmentiphaga sp. NML080357]|uniref:DUF4149 domain-containing protein n=1 Tax=Pigmentiphaga sp. NML080357 TaxID=2008675 RepID=UPI000B41F348|nr:DUF4149 domain-containing protein [Pigmentiphaga sp. NML080357]OVZ58867.1 hypothetical protein CDO44_14340 [Pigmentiphaga sp. NML080357]